MPVLLIVILFIILVLIVFNIKIVPQSKAYVVERLGAYKETLGVGLNILVPIIDRVAKVVSLKEQVIDFRSEPVITSDNVTIEIDTVIYFQITDPKLYTYGVERPLFAIEKLTSIVLRNIIGELKLDNILVAKDIIKIRMRDILDEATDAWGIKINRVELKIKDEVK